ncbi:MAG: ABC transporter ATP-binding protein [Opitutales bacterium]|nr:ABC transporter ATP-binding protein [Opitutales bacterium]
MSITLPSYREQAPEVKERFDRLKQRPVKMEVRGLNKVFGSTDGPVTALQGINFTLHRREFLSVIGPSGCGKSTLIRILAGLEIPTSGQVSVDGQVVRGPGADRGMVFQSYTLFPWLTVKQNVMFGLKIGGNSANKAEAEAREWINLVGLDRFENSYPNQLSGGMKQRVAIARALANRPKVLLMDEPFGALDAQTRATMQSYLLEIWRNVDVSIVFITHDLDEAIYLADRILVLKANPGEVEELIEVPVRRPRTTGQFLEPPFLATRKRLEELIHPPEKVLKQRLKIARMTEVGDDVE